MSSLALRGVDKIFGTTHIIKNVDLEVPDGDFTVFVGPSGCGKSTLLRMIAGLEQATAGDILLDGKRVNEVAAAQRGLAMVFQSYALYPHMSVRQNLAFGLENSRASRAEITARVDEAAEMLAIRELLQRKPRQLSGGQRQRGSRSAGRSSAAPASSCSTSRSRTSTPSCASPRAASSPGCSAGSAPP
jgi:ABC-type sugar transport system ATPase subunit